MIHPDSLLSLIGVVIGRLAATFIQAVQTAAACIDHYSNIGVIRALTPGMS